MKQFVKNRACFGVIMLIEWIKVSQLKGSGLPFRIKALNQNVKSGRYLSVTQN